MRLLPRQRVALTVIGAVFTVAACSGSSASAPPTTVPTAPGGSAASTETTDPAVPTLPETTVAPTTTMPAYATGDDDFLFDPTQLHDFEINLDEPKLAILDEDPAAEEYVEGSLTFNGETIGQIGVRYKGSVGSFLGCTESGFGGLDGGGFEPSGAKTCSRLSMKLKINWDDPDRDFYGVRRLLLHSTKRDDSHMIERSVFWMFGQMGVPAPRATLARVTVNGEFLGIFTLVEQPDGRFADEHFPDGSGNLYKEVWPFDGIGSPQPEERLLDGLETNKGADAGVEIMQSFAEEFAAAEPSQRRAVLEKWTDIDTMLRFLVVDRAVSNEDGPLHWYCGDVTPRDNEEGEATFAATDTAGCAPHNFFWYEDPTARKIHLIPWDVDNSLNALATQFIPIPDELGATTDNCQPFFSGVIPLPQISASCDLMIAELAAMDEEYAAIRAELLAGPFSVEGIDEQLELWASLIEESIVEASKLHDDVATPEAWRAAVDSLHDHFADQRLNGGKGR
jgi:spore coat protein CotH